MIRISNGPCDKRPGHLEIFVREHGKWLRAFSDLECSRKAARIALNSMGLQAAMCMEGKLPPSRVTHVEDYRFIYADEDKALATEDLTEAQSFLSQLLKKDKP